MTRAPEKFDEAFYANLGVNNAIEQERQLRLKFDASASIEHRSALFVGCATGLEPLYWRDRGIAASGCEVSPWAVENAHPHAKSFVRLYDGQRLDWLKENAVDAVLSFDVLTLIPRDMRTVLAVEMTRVASKAIIIRTTISDPETCHKPDHGIDGVIFKLESWDYWDRLFTYGGKFWLKSSDVRVANHDRREAVFVFERR